ncbi:hypothetical protein Taro_044437 [Colocasia esculenta]|uniref:Uncharacterized protein n=1 Tax=Colocasia esculenta TaxID=4460 RepID=A0A843WYB8_COLES|nr:hypothetical protein [Colocasia esculenta]
MRRVGRGGSPEVVAGPCNYSSPCSSAETNFRELDDVFLQTQTRIWLGEVLHVRFDEETCIADLLADGELLDTNRLMAGVRFGPLVVQDHARHGYLVVPTRFGSFPPVVEFSNFLGVAFVDILHPETKKEAEAEAEHEVEVKKTNEELSCHVHHVEHGNHYKNKEKKTNRYPQQTKEVENIVTRRARVSKLGKSVRIGDLRIHLQAKRTEAVPERVTMTVPVKNSFQALIGKREIFNTFKGKLPLKLIKFKQVWRPKKVQTPRQEEPVPQEAKPRETVDVKVSSYQRPPHGFKAKIQQGGLVLIPASTTRRQNFGGPPIFHLSGKGLPYRHSQPHMTGRGRHRLNSVVAEVEAFLVKYPTNSFTNQKSKPVDKKPTGKEVHVVDLKTFEKQRDGGKAVAGSSDNKTEPQRKVIPFQDKMRKPYSFPKEKTKTLFDWGIRYNKITLPTPKRPDQAAKKDDPRYCLYHQILGHPLEDCYVFKDIMESLIKKGELQIGDYKVDPPQPYELPARQAAINMISLYQQLPEEVSEASTEKTYESHILTPIKE